MSIIEVERILKKVQRQAEDEIVDWGCGLILKELGFIIDKYTNKIIITDNNHMINVLFKEDEIKKLIIKIDRNINYNLKNHLFDILEKEYIPKVIVKTQEELAKSANLFVTQRIREKIFRNYANKLEEKLTEEVMNDPKIREILIGKL